MNILNLIKKAFLPHKAEVALLVESKDNTTVARRLNRAIRIKRSLELVTNKSKREALQKELEEHLKVLQENANALTFLNP
jgi:hypothetical protein